MTPTTNLLKLHLTTWPECSVQSRCSPITVWNNKTYAIPVMTTVCPKVPKSMGYSNGHQHNFIIIEYFPSRRPIKIGIFPRQKHSSEVTSQHTATASLFNLVLFVCSFSKGSSYLAPIQTEHHLYNDAIFLGRHKMQLPKTSSFEATLSLKYSQGTCLSSYLLASMYNL